MKKRVRITLTIDAVVDSVAVKAAALGAMSVNVDDVDMTDEERASITQEDLDAGMLHAVGDVVAAVQVLAFRSAPWSHIAAGVPSMEVPSGAVDLSVRALRDDEQARYEL